MYVCVSTLGVCQTFIHYSVATFAFPLITNYNFNDRTIASLMDLCYFQEAPPLSSSFNLKAFAKLLLFISLFLMLLCTLFCLFIVSHFYSVACYALGRHSMFAIIFLFFFGVASFTYYIISISCPTNCLTSFLRLIFSVRISNLLRYCSVSFFPRLLTGVVVSVSLSN